MKIIKYILIRVNVVYKLYNVCDSLATYVVTPVFRINKFKCFLWSLFSLCFVHNRRLSFFNACFSDK